MLLRHQAIRPEHPANPAYGLANPVLVFDQGKAHVTFKTWTAMETILSVVGLGFILLLSLFV